MKLNRNIILSIGSIIVLLLGVGVFNMGTQTYATWKQYQHSEQQLSDIHHAPQVLAQQEIRLNTLRKQAGSLQSETISVNDLVDLAQYLDKLCERYHVRLVTLPRTFGGKPSSEQVSVTTNTFSLEGDIEALLQAIYQIEQLDRVGVVSRLMLETNSYFERGKEQHELIADIRLQRLTHL